MASKKLSILILLQIVICHLTIHAQLLDRNDSLARNLPISVTQDAVSLAKYLKENFKSDDKIVRALYIWLASNIKYDLDKLDSIALNLNRNSIEEDVVDYTLRYKKGVCENYATVFTKICTLNSIESFMVTGYTKLYGKPETRYSHAWNVAKIDNTWYLFDPTWGAGFVRYERFHKRFTFDYYKANPDSILKSHMPFDPIWQLKEFPISHKDFLQNTYSSQQKINFKDSIELYLNLPEYLKIKIGFERSELYGLNQPELQVLYLQNKEFASNFLNSFYVQQFNSAVYEFNNARKAYNEYLKNSNSKSRNSKLSEVCDRIKLSKDFISKTSNEAVSKEKIEQLKKDLIKLEMQLKPLIVNKRNN